MSSRGAGTTRSPIPDLILAAVLGTLIGGKLYYTLVITHDIRDFFSRAGFVFWGGFIGSVIACYITIKLKKLNFIRISDVAGICIAAGYSVGRTGCWAVGDDYGRPWNGPLAVAFPEGAPASTARNMQALFGIQPPAGTSPDTLLSVHPTQLYETALGFVMFADPLAAIATTSTPRAGCSASISCWRGSSASSSSSCARRTTGSSAR